ncbi:calcium-activated chloride channel regulator 3A-1-like [Penaeus indicus]|uniref:calcium-activated chloride channel regulator 3A-1-like n=1 Tax=Penaeus indicus TaxID=29960 RepID=UPI00300C39ED
MAGQVQLAVAALVTLVAATEANVQLKDNGYEGVLVAISPSVNESYAGDVIASIKKTFSDASEVLFKATHQRAFFRDVKILLPKTWTKTPSDAVALKENFDESHIRVDVGSRIYGNQPHTEQPGGCGDPGLYIHLTPEYLVDDKESDVWGPRSKVLVHEWAKLRWGVFDEFGYPNDEMYPLFYASQNIVGDKVEVIALPNHCADKKLLGKLRDITGSSCSYVGDLPDENCRFIPDDDQDAVSSLMSLYYIASVEEFCGETRHHNLMAPNKHNNKCNLRSVWSVIESHPDFKDDNNPQTQTASPTTFTVLRQEAAKFALVLDYSNSMWSYNRIKKLQATARRWILHEVAEGSSVGIIKFREKANLEAPLTVIKGEASRKKLADRIDTKVMSNTSIGAGLSLAMDEMLNREKNAVILLITDGKENESPHIHDIEDQLAASGIRVVTIAFGAEADQQLEKIAQLTDGKTYTVVDTDSDSQLLDAFLGALTYQPGDYVADTKVRIHAYSGTDKQVNKEFLVDASIGRDMLFQLKTNASEHTVSPPYLVRPDGTRVETATFEPLIVSWTIKVSLAEPGRWMWVANMSGNNNSYIQVDVSAKARNPDILPIFTRAWTSSGSSGVDATVSPVIVYAEVKQGSNPVIGATVRAYIDHISIPEEAMELDLLDNGQGADSQAGDGIYSRYLTQYPSTGRYIVRAQAWNNGSAFINNGFTANRAPHRRHARVFTAKPLEMPIYCCGSKVPFNAEIAEYAEEFSRFVAAGSIQIHAYSGTDKQVNKEFLVDASIGRDMLFQLKTNASEHTVSPPYLVRPDGTRVETATFEPLIVSWTIKVSLAEAWNNGSAFINNGFTANRAPHRRHARVFTAKPLEMPIYCCGSKVPFNAEIAEYAEEFSRFVAAGSIQVTKIPETGDAFPPSRVTDLQVAGTSHASLTLTWTAPGDDLDSGTVSRYEIRLSSNDSDLLDVDAEYTTLLTFEDSVQKSELYVDAGETVKATLDLKESIEIEKVYYLTLRASDNVGKLSSYSNVALVFIANEPAGQKLEIWILISIVSSIFIIMTAVCLRTPLLNR